MIKEVLRLYVGSLVGVTTQVDKSTLNRADYIRVKITAKDVSKIPKYDEGAIIPYLYDFIHDREVILEEKKEDNAGVVKVNKMDPKKLTLQKSIMFVSSAQVTMQQDVGKSSVGEGSAKKQQDDIPKAVAVEEVIMMPLRSPGGRVVDKSVESLSTRPMVRPEKVDVLDLLRAGIDKVQGLSGADLNESEDDMVFEEV
jgi:hypothetical protein